MNSEILTSTPLYTVISTITDTPYLAEGKYFVVYTDRQKAAKLAQKLNQKISGSYHGAPIKTCIITDCDKFFRELVYMGFSLFIYDAAGTIHNLTELYEVDFVLPEKDKEIYSEVMAYQRMVKSSHVGKKKEAKIYNAQMYLNRDENKHIMHRFYDQQKVLKRYYKVVYEPMDNNPPEQPLIPINTESDTEPVQASPANVPVEKPLPMRRPVVSVIMFVLAGLFAVAVLGTVIQGEMPGVCGYGVAALCYVCLGIVMRKMYLKLFGTAIFAVFFLADAIRLYLSGENIALDTVATIIFVAAFLIANRKTIFG